MQKAVAKPHSSSGASTGEVGGEILWKEDKMKLEMKWRKSNEKERGISL